MESGPLFEEDDEGGALLAIDADEDVQETGEDMVEEDEDTQQSHVAAAPPPQRSSASGSMNSGGKQIQMNAGNTQVSPSRMGNKKQSVFREVKDDPNIYNLTQCSKELSNAYLTLQELEGAVKSIMMSSMSSGGMQEQMALEKLGALNDVCDKLGRLVQRKKDILAVEKMLVKRNEAQLQEAPNEYISVISENLSLSRSAFQKVLMEQ